MLPRPRRFAIVLLPLGLATAAPAQTLVRATVATGGAQANGASVLDLGAISADGNRVVFRSIASNLVAGDTNATLDVFVRDLAAGTTTRVSVDTAGNQANNTSGLDQMISADGRYVAFRSSATNLVAGDTNMRSDTFVRDLVLNTTERTSVSSAGLQSNGGSSPTCISPDGRYVLFINDSTDIVAGDTNFLPDVFLRDRQLGVTTRVSVGTGGIQANGTSMYSWMSPDARFIVFESTATNLGGGPGAFYDVFVHDRQTQTTTLVSVDVGGTGADGDSLWPTITADGRYVVFQSFATNLVPNDTNGEPDVFLRDLVLGTTTRISVDPMGAQVSGGGSRAPTITPDGRFVAYACGSPGIVPGDTNGLDDLFVLDRQTSTTRRVSVGPGAQQADGFSNDPSITPDGRFTAFWGDATVLVAGDTNAATDGFVVDWAPAVAFGAFCAGDGVDASHTTPCPCANSGGFGRGCANSVVASGAALSASGTTQFDAVVLSTSGTPATASAIYLQGDALADAVFGDGVRCTGGNLVRLRTRASVSGASTFPDSTDTVTLSQRGGVVPGSGARRHYQTYYRNAAATFCPPETFNVTNGWIVDW